MQITMPGYQRVHRALAKLSHLDTRKLLDTLGQLVEGQVKRRLTSGDQEGPDGKTWPDLSIPYEKWKVRQGKGGFPMLQFDGGLIDSITHVVGNDQVEIGSPLKKAATLQHGDKRQAFGKHMATYQPRPFIGLSSQDEEDVEDATVVWLRREMGILV